MYNVRILQQYRSTYSPLLSLVLLFKYILFLYILQISQSSVIIIALKIHVFEKKMSGEK